MRPPLPVWLFATLFVTIVFFSDDAATQQTSGSAARSTDWEALIPQIPAALGSKLAPCRATHIAIVETADLTGDGNTEAVVDYCQLGAYTDTVTVMRLENGKPLQAKFRDGHGKPVDPDFSDGASVMHGAELKLFPEVHAVFQAHWDADAAGNLTMENCGGTAFVWNPQNETFDMNRKLSEALTERECRRIVDRRN